MVGFMNEEAWQKTVETGFVTFYSRSRNKLWLKGETSGHKLVVKQISTDCDHDAVLIKVDALGPGVCHEGYESCFFRQLDGGEWKITEERAYDPAVVYETMMKLKLGIPKAASKTRPSICSAAPVFKSPPAADRIFRRLTIPRSNAC